VVDDGSTDGTLEFVAQFPVHILRSQGGRSNARNTGIEYATGEFVLFVDSDWVLDQQLVEECVSVSLRENYDGIRIPVRHFVSDPDKGGFWDIARARDIEHDAQRFPSTILFWRHSVIRDMRFSEGSSLAEDLVFQLALVNAGASIGSTRSGLTHIFLQRSSMAEVLLRSYKYGKLYAMKQSSVSLLMLTKSTSIVRPMPAYTIARLLGKIGSVRLLITMPVYVFVKYTGFVLGLILG
jgi:glycosyltransferase involved in cell wall biosynthesis